jgi:hypothetical protein
MRIFYAMVVTLCASDLVSAAPPNDVIRSGTPITLGQYCTAVKGSMQGCNSLVGDFERECRQVGMQFVAGNTEGRGPQARCIRPE